jgi:glucosyl-dolichyl phosphate glucuronosyltransferase
MTLHSTNKPPETSVVVCTHNRAASLSTTLSSFSGLVMPRDVAWELIVVDNCSNDNTREVVDSFARTSPFPVRYVFEIALGKSRALNTGIANAEGHIVAFTDDDVILHPAWLSNLKKGFDEFGCMAIAGRVIPLWNQPKPDWLEMADQQAIVNFEFGDEWKEIQRPPLGANSAFRKTAFLKYGLFRSDLGPSGERRGITCEDTEFGQRLIHGGEKVFYSPTAIVYHPVAPHRSTKSFFQTWYYHDGRSSVRANCLLDKGIQVSRIPLWMYGGVISNCLRWIFSFNSKHRFQYKLATYRGVGRVVEAARLARAGRLRSENSISKEQTAA